ncbi:PTS glucose transporter subunit IIA [Pseudonocardia sp. S2-4]|uniref:PTS glucose transporter subunit IIA n=1 Tax=Pseudonocardia humida TaxID=2800819 RepID=A0ABT1AAS0_9PSEU|nr:PTS glucose transporter subunit IIA [Pseudonocardia humida]
MQVLAPLAGTLVGLADVPDPVFAEQLVGAGAAVEPAAGAGRTAVCAPVAGTVVKAHPHAFIVQHESGAAVLVHVGIDTVKLAGEGFERHVDEGAVVAAGDPVVTFDPTAVRGRGLSAVTPVVVLDSAPDSVPGLRTGQDVDAGEPLYAWEG